MNAASAELQMVTVPCPLCEGTDSRSVVDIPDYWYAVHGNFHVVRCQNCGHEFMNPRPAAESLADCYPDLYEPHQEATESTPAASQPWYLRLRGIPGMRRLYHWLMDDRSQPVPEARKSGSQSLGPQSAGSPSPAALELGCAAGRYLLELQERGWVVQGVELCEPPAEAARRQGLDVIQGTLETVDFHEQQFDLAAAWMVIEHVPEPRLTLSHLRRVLRPGGRLLLSVPNARCWQRRLFGRYWYGWDVPRHLQHFGPASISRLLKDTGFTQVQVIHQRTLLSMMGSIGLWLRRGRDKSSRLADWFVKYPDQPRLWMQLLLAPWAIFLSWLKQGERLTVSASVDSEFVASREDGEDRR